MASRREICGMPLIFVFLNRYIICIELCLGGVTMDNKELGYLFRLALSCVLDNTKSISIGEPDMVTHNFINITLDHIDLIPTEDLMRMYIMIYSYFNCSSVLADSISVEDFINTYQSPRKSDRYMSFADLLMEEVKRRTDGNTDDKSTSHRSE